MCKQLFAAGFFFRLLPPSTRRKQRLTRSCRAALSHDWLEVEGFVLLLLLLLLPTLWLVASPPTVPTSSCVAKFACCGWEMMSVIDAERPTLQTQFCCLATHLAFYPDNL